MSGRNISGIKEKLLWGKSAGRCEFAGCNKPLVEHQLAIEDINLAEKAHIKAFSPGGARYDEDLTDIEKNSLDNIMLLCPECHKLIDDNPEQYPVELLKFMKKKHEDRIRWVTDIDDYENAVAMSYFSPIAGIMPQYEDRVFFKALLEHGFVLENKNVINLSCGNLPYEDGNNDYYSFQMDAIKRGIQRSIIPVLKKDEKLAVFALAPMPLLIYLGTMLSDIQNIYVFQCNREGQKWGYTEKSTGTSGVKYAFNKPKKRCHSSNTVAMIIALSASINSKRVFNVIGNDVPIYELTIDEPNRYFVTSDNVVDDFIRFFRKCIETIKYDNPEMTELKLFPAMPNSLAVRMGLDYMPKSDPIWAIYDQINYEKGFVEVIRIGEENEY